MSKEITEKCKECGREEWGYGSLLNEDGYCPRCAIHHNEEKIKKLQEQLKEANEVITMPEDIMYHDELVEKREKYLKKWGVK